MATVRIYKVAEVIGTTSQEVLALLKRNHGIELKSASSTVEEMVARQFVNRLARERNISLPKGDPFGSTSAKTTGASRKGSTVKKIVEPPKPAAPTLGPPRLIKTIRPPTPAVEPDAQEPDAAGEVPADTQTSVEAESSSLPSDDAATDPPAPSTVATEGAPAAGLPPDAVDPKPQPAGRLVPHTLRLRIEEPGRPPQPARALTPAKRPAAPTAPRMVKPPPAVLPAEIRQRTGIAGRPGGPPRPNTAAMLGGPRPLPSQPVRPQVPGRPGFPSRPSLPGRPPMRPIGSRPLRRHRARPQAPVDAAPTPLPPVTRTVTLAEGMTVKDLADKLEVRVKDVLAKLLMKRVILTINSPLETPTARDIARDFGADVEMRTFEEELDAEVEDSNPEDLKPRAPVVTVMGHVDHGKTSLLDGIRETRVAERESGGITQHIGAYHVDVGNDRTVVFLDTPGHEAFTLMRARGAKVTDVVVLVVAADDGVMPQTREAIDHAKAANVPIVVAINKIDKSNANQDNVKQGLAELGLVPEDWGGQTVMVPVSAKKRENLDQLLEMILISSDILELKANPSRPASGVILEAKLDRGRGPVATVLVQDGTLRVGDNFIAGPVVGRVRALIDDRGHQIKVATPSMPVEVLGLTSLPQPGDTFQLVADAAKARQIATFRQAQAKDRALGAKGGRLTLSSLKEQLAEGSVKDLPLIVKADVRGSAEVLADALTKLSDEKVRVIIVHSGVGAINESDVLLASASNAIVIGFNVRPDRNAATVAEREEVDVRLHSVIYKVTDEIKKGMVGLLDPTYKEVRIGSAEVREVFKVPKLGAIAGCVVSNGRITRSGDAKTRLMRDNVVVFEGKLASLRRFKDDVNEVKSGFECGIGIERFNDIKVGDVIEVFEMEREKLAL